MIIVYDKTTFNVLGMIDETEYEIKTKLDKRKKQLGFSNSVELVRLNNIPQEVISNPQDYIYNPTTKTFSFNITKYKNLKKQQIKEEMYKIAASGFCSPTLKKKVNSLREDLDNLKNLYDYAKANGIEDITLRLYDNSFASITINELDILIKELIEHGLALYQTKWELEQAIEKATTIEEINAISWPSPDESACNEITETVTTDNTDTTIDASSSDNSTISSSSTEEQ